MSDASVRDALGGAVDALRATGVETPRLDAELLLCEATGWERARLAAEPEAGVPPAAARQFGELVRRRLRREPVAYIAGRKGFRNLELAVDPRVLVPRPETELLVEVALERRPRSVLDVGTGSGAIALAVAEEVPDSAVTATDTSPAALEVARANAARLGLADRVCFAEGTWPDEESDARGGAFDLLLANLPYIADGDWPTLQPEVRDWEPREALLAGPDGLDAIRALLAECGRGFNRYANESSATLALEVGDGQSGRVAELMRGAGFAGIEVRKDLAGIERVVVGER
ncbi:MAG TPA: peptide chain release factor N(5)-glutamine methyltransferase [Solirubrobacterales bacterium]